MSKQEGIYEIGEIDFKDIKVKVYHDKYEKNYNCAWSMRNLDTCYQGTVFMNCETGKMTYPEDAVIPNQTDHDREMLPKFVIVGETEMSNELTDGILKYFESNYKRRNKSYINKENGSKL